MAKTSATSLSGRRANPHKIFSLAETNLPGKVNDLFSLCAYFFTTNSLVHPVIYKMSEYPITKFKYTSGDERDQHRTKALIEDHWKGASPPHRDGPVLPCVRQLLHHGHRGG